MHISPLTVPQLRKYVELRDGTLFYAYGRRKGTPVTSRARKRYPVIKLAGKLYYTHRVVLALANGRWPAQHTDHINGDRTDFRLQNLREATASENHYNSKARTAIRGVCYRRPGVWIAQISANRRNYWLGTFSSQAAAAAARQAAEKRLHGAFAYSARGQ